MITLEQINDKINENSFGVRHYNITTVNNFGIVHERKSVHEPINKIALNNFRLFINKLKESGNIHKLLWLNIGDISVSKYGYIVIESDGKSWEMDDDIESLNDRYADFRFKF